MASPSAPCKEMKRVLVWIDEKSHKAESAELLSRMQEAAKEFDYHLRCFKKAPTYEAWLQRASPKEHVLVAAHRELKPCISMFKQDSEVPTPTFMAVFVGELRLENRVARAVKCMNKSGLPGDFDLYWVNSTDKLRMLLKGCAGKDVSRNLRQEGHVGSSHLRDPSCGTPGCETLANPSDEEFRHAESWFSYSSHRPGLLIHPQHSDLPSDFHVDSGNCRTTRSGKQQGFARRHWCDITDGVEDDDSSSSQLGLVHACAESSDEASQSLVEDSCLVHDAVPGMMVSCKSRSSTPNQEGSRPGSVSVEDLPGPVGQFLQSLFPNHSCEEIHAALLAAQPDFYEL